MPKDKSPGLKNFLKITKFYTKSREDFEEKNSKLAKLKFYTKVQKHRLYIDTSVFGGFYDDEFAEFTIPLFDRVNNGEFEILYSTVTQDELENAPERVRNLVRQLKREHTGFIEITNESVELANKYIDEQVVGQTSYADCLHIALATINRADYLISWNFKHIVNVERIRGFNAVNIKYGYKFLEIRSPRDFVKYENNEGKNF